LQRGRVRVDAKERGKREKRGSEKKRGRTFVSEIRETFWGKTTPQKQGLMQKHNLPPKEGLH